MNAPVALFVYNRLGNTEKTINSLKANFLSSETDVFVFSDEGKNKKSYKEVNEVRNYLRTVSGFKSFSIIEREENYYLERNIIEGISYVLSKYDSVIVLEDDIVTSPYFLTYMNDAFEKYRDCKKVMHIAGFSNLSIENMSDTYFTPHMSGWGWGTWRDRWQYFVHYQSREEALKGMSESDIDKIQYGGAFPCLRSLDRNPIPWDICWELAIYKKGGLCLTPSHTLIKNIGIYNGTHFRNMSFFGHYEYDRDPLHRRIVLESNEIVSNDEVEKLYRDAFVDNGMRYNLIGKILRKLKRGLHL